MFERKVAAVYTRSTLHAGEALAARNPSTLPAPDSLAFISASFPCAVCFAAQSAAVRRALRCAVFPRASPPSAFSEARSCARPPSVSHLDSQGGDLLEGSLRASSYVVTIAEGPVPEGALLATQIPPLFPLPTPLPTPYPRLPTPYPLPTRPPTHSAGAHARGEATEIALVAVEPSTGDVLVGSFRDSALRSALEGHLLSLNPGEVLLAHPLSAPTQKLISGLFAGAGAGGDSGGGGWGARVEARSRDGLERGGALAAVAAFVSARDPGKDQSADTPSPSADPSADDMARLSALPDLVLQALAVSAAHLASFGLGAVLRRVSAFRPLASAFEMALPPNALRQLDVLSVGGGAVGAQGSLLWLVDHCRTPFGRRMLQRWVVRALSSPAPSLLRESVLSSHASCALAAAPPLRRCSFA